MTDKPKKSWTEALSSIDSIDRRMNAVAFVMDYLKDPEDALIDWRAPEDMWRQYEESYYGRLYDFVAEATGADRDQLADKDKRTPEQSRTLLAVSARAQQNRWHAFLDSVFISARLYIGELQGELDQRGVLSVTYFFALHPEINPRTKGELTEDQKTELEGIYHHFAEFVATRYKGIDLDGDPATVTDIVRAFAEAEKGGKLEPLQLHQIQKATRYTLNNSKVFNVLGVAIPKGRVDGQLEITVIPDKKTGRDVLTYMSLSYQGDDNVQLKGRKVITGFDKAVYNSVSTLYEAGNRQVSAQDVFRTMNGNTKRRPSPKQTERITNSIRKMMYTAIYMDFSAELQRIGMTIDDDRITRGKVETQMLQATIGMAQTENGRTVTVYRLSAEPILLTYCKSKKQIITVPIALLDTSEAASSTETITAIREYLIQQIELMRHDRRNNATIRYSTIYEKTDTPAPENRTEARRLRNQIKAVLDVWTARGYIKGYADAKEGQSVTGITILYDPVAKDEPAKESTRKPRKG